MVRLVVVMVLWRLLLLLLLCLLVVVMVVLLLLLLLLCLLLWATIPTTTATSSSTSAHPTSCYTVAPTPRLSAIQMNQFMLLEVRALCKGLHTHVAMKRFLASVRTLVLRQVVFLREDTVTEDTVVWLYTTVHIFVCIEMGFLREGLVANITHKRPLPSVGALVVVKAIALGENFRAKRTMEMFPCFRSQLVTVQVGFKGETLSADATFVRLIAFWRGPYHAKLTRHCPCDGGWVADT